MSTMSRWANSSLPYMEESSVSSHETYESCSSFMASSSSMTSRQRCDSWQCPVCTFFNEKEEFLACEMCGQTKPDGVNVGRRNTPSVLRVDAIAVRDEVEWKKTRSHPQKESRPINSSQFDGKMKQEGYLQKELLAEVEKGHTSQSREKGRESDDWTRDMKQMLRVIQIQNMDDTSAELSEASIGIQVECLEPRRFRKIVRQNGVRQKFSDQELPMASSDPCVSDPWGDQMDPVMAFQEKLWNRIRRSRHSF